MKSKLRPFGLVATACALAACVAHGAPAPTPTARRQALLQAAGAGVKSIPVLQRGLDDANMVVRRTAVRLLAELGDPAEAALATAFGNSDPLARRIALTALARLEQSKAMPHLGKALEDESEAVRLMAVEYLATMSPGAPGVAELLAKGCKDSSDGVRKVAVRATWPFRRDDSTSLRERKDYDHDVTVLTSIPLPKDDWRFRLDPERKGHTAKWYAPGLDDSAWDTISIEQAWQKAGYEYIGVSWYRRWIELPEKPEHAAADISFQGVDESAWVWVNGQYVGDHDVGATGWDKPFLLDVTKVLKWGEKNQITVRAMNTAHAGGIWRPVTIDVLK